MEIEKRNFEIHNYRDYCNRSIRKQKKLIEEHAAHKSNKIDKI